MSEGRPMASYEEMVAALSELLRAGRTGTFYITTGDNHSGTFGLDKGKIVSLGYNRVKGRDALAAMRDIKEVRHRFSPLGTGPMEGCPTTDEILRFLRFLDGPAPAKAANPPPSPVPANTPRPAAPAAPASTAKPAAATPPATPARPAASAAAHPAPQPLNAPAPRAAPGGAKPAAAQTVPGQRLPVAQIKVAIIQEATEYLGPMAPHVCEEHFARTPPLSPASLLKVVDAIADEVEPSHRDRFRMRVLHHVELLLG